MTVLPRPPGRLLGHPLSRRGLLRAGSGLVLYGVLLPQARSVGHAAEATPTQRLIAGPARAPLIGADYPETDVWADNGQVPGPEIRVRQGDRPRIPVTDKLGEETTVHWHGVRTPNAMDGVPGLTQAPIAPGATFLYEFDAVDAGTFWYHPHVNSSEQIDRGLSGALIVEEREPLPVDRDVTGVLDDWRLLKDAANSGDFGNLMDMSHGGRMGNLPTTDGRLPDQMPVRAGERVRLRLINVANARVFALRFQDLRPMVIAMDGQPVEPHEPEDGRVLPAPAQRLDLVIDMTGKPGSRSPVVDDAYSGRAYQLVAFACADAPPLRDRPPETDLRLPANSVAEPDLTDAIRYEMVLGGGMMGRMAEATLDGRMTDIRILMRNGKAWAVNGTVAGGSASSPS